MDEMQRLKNIINNYVKQHNDDIDAQDNVILAMNQLGYTPTEVLFTFTVQNYIDTKDTDFIRNMVDVIQGRVVREDKEPFLDTTTFGTRKFILPVTEIATDHYRGTIKLSDLNSYAEEIVRTKERDNRIYREYLETFSVQPFVEKRFRGLIDVGKFYPTIITLNVLKGSKINVRSGILEVEVQNIDVIDGYARLRGIMGSENKVELNSKEIIVDILNKTEEDAIEMGLDIRNSKSISKEEFYSFNIKNPTVKVVRTLNDDEDSPLHNKLTSSYPIGFMNRKLSVQILEYLYNTREDDVEMVVEHLKEFFNMIKHMNEYSYHNKLREVFQSQLLFGILLVVSRDYKELGIDESNIEEILQRISETNMVATHRIVTYDSKDVTEAYLDYIEQKAKEVTS